MAKIIISFIAALLMLLASPSLAASAEDGKIEGSLINSTAGSTSSVADLYVVLQTYQGSNALGEKSTTSDQNGNFKFEGLSTDPSNIYVIKAIFQNIDYYSEGISFGDNETQKSSQVKVYDTTTSDKSIAVDMTHVILSFAGQVLSVKENYLFLNNSDLTYIGLPSTQLAGKNETLKFTTPPEVTSVSGSVGLEQSTIAVRNGGFSDTSAVTPEGIFISYNYKLAIDTDQKTVSWKFNYDTGRFDLLLESQTVTVAGNRLTEEEPLAIAGKTYRHYSSLGLKKGDSLTVQLSGLLPGQPQSSFTWAWLALIPIAAVVIIFLILKRKKTLIKPVEADNPERINKEQLMAEIAALDDSYEEGNISQEEYEKLRKEKKQQLLNITKT